MIVSYVKLTHLGSKNSMSFFEYSQINTESNQLSFFGNLWFLNDFISYTILASWKPSDNKNTLIKLMRILSISYYSGQSSSF